VENTDAGWQDGIDWVRNMREWHAARDA
jgi:hypothetical protein